MFTVPKPLIAPSQADIKHALQTDYYTDRRTLKAKTPDHDGNPVVCWSAYFGYRKGVYQVVGVLKHVSLVVKVLSGRGVPVHKQRVMVMSNSWLRLY